MSLAPSLGLEPPPMLHCSSGEDTSPACGSPHLKPGTLRHVCQPGLGGVTVPSASISRFWILWLFFFFKPPCKVGHLLLFQLPLRFFGTRQILSFDSEGIHLSGPEDHCRGGEGDAEPFHRGHWST